MENVAVQKIDDAKPFPFFQELEHRFEAVRRRAFEMFEKRGCETGHELDDWLKAERDVMGWPAAELTETDSQYELTVTLPGFEPKDVRVIASPSEIAVHAEVEFEKKAKKEKCLWTEFQSNNVYRRFELPGTIDVEKIKACIDRGVLHITAPKGQQAEEKRIAVRAA